MRMCLDHAIVNLTNACTRLTWRAYVEAVGAIITKFSSKAGQTASRSRLVQDTGQFPPKRTVGQSGISCFCLDPGFFVTHFHAPISKACHDTLPSDHHFCSSTWSNFRTNRIETTTSSRDISAQTTALLLSAV